MVGVNSRALRLAQRAESCRISWRLNPETRSHKQSVDTFRQTAACKDEQVREAENEQRCNRRLVPEYREQEQSVDTER